MQISGPIITDSRLKTVIPQVLFMCFYIACYILLRIVTHTQKFQASYELTHVHLLLSFVVLLHY